MAGGPILALDLGTTTGWAIGVPGTMPICKSVSFPKASVSGPGRLYASFEDWLWDLIEVHQPVMIAYEAPMPPQAMKGINAGRIALSLVGHLEQVCYRATIPCYEQDVWAVRGYFVAHRGAKKEAVMAECRKRGWAFDTDNAADAAAVWAFACHHRAPISEAA